MKIAVGSDHAGFELKNYVVQWFQENGHEPVDMGPFNEESVDYPDYARKVGESIVDGTCQEEFSYAEPVSAFRFRRTR